ncbi:MAG: hypothetical protein CVU56_13170 [Deltaproteobacteria bacterium HGW-Deltaproteobacteria-14]|nr:MAG: hypothetical protein CVU56_13170 [Deltaproteobacteria bacterium HGW-Deltaproteobacteria-14]
MHRTLLVAGALALVTATATAAPPPEPASDAPEAATEPATPPEGADAASAEQAPPAADPGVSAPPAGEEASPPAAQDPGLDARPWALIISGGFQFNLMESSPLGRQLLGAGYGADAIGPSFAVLVQRYVLDWLVVGGGLDLRYGATDTADNGAFSGSLAPTQTSELWRVAASAYVQPTLCLEYGSCKRAGVFFGFQLGVAAGPTWWVLRDQADLGFHVRLEAALLWEVGADDVILGFRLAHALVWQSGMGPRDLGTPFLWLPATEIRLGYRW